MKRINISKYRDKKYWMRFRYGKYFTTLPVDKKTILFESFHGKEVSDSPLAMAKALLEMPEGSEFRLYFSTNDVKRDQAVLDALGLDIGLVHIHSDEYAKLLATAGYLINNSSFPSYITRREDQTYLQTWHGTPWKTLGRRMKGELTTIQNSQHNFIQADYLLFPNEFTRDAIMHDYILDDIYTGKVILHGYPRNSVFCDKEKAAEIKHFCGDDNYSTLAYMPTWRGQDNKNISTDAFTKEIYSMLKKLDESLADDQKLYVNLHPIVQKSLDLSGLEHTFTFPKNVEKYEFINSVDALITDYSSIFFDYSITGKPIILFTYDYDNYVSERGMYFGIEELPFARVDTLDELSEMISSKSYTKLSYADDAEYKNKFIQYDSVDAARDLMKYLITGESGNLRIEDHSDKKTKGWNLIDCPELPTPYDLDPISKEAGPDDIVIFHQAHFGPKTGERMKDLYDGKYPYVFTTESVPETFAESKSKSKKTREAVKLRNIRRVTGDINVASYRVNTLLRVDVMSIETKGKNIRIKMRCPADIGKITDVTLDYRSNIETLSHHMEFAAAKNGKWIDIEASMDMSVLKPGCLYWDIFTYAERNGSVDAYHVMVRRPMRIKLKSLFYQCDLGDYIVFPHVSQYNALAFTLREKTKYDKSSLRYKELGAFAYYRLFGKLYNKRKIWLVYEKFCSAAQDNGYYFFKYCMDKLSEAEKKNIFFVIDKSSNDYKNLKPYDKNVIQFMSFRHMLYSLAAKVYVGSDSKKHLYAWRPRPNVISGRINRKPVFFLQHGVTALKRVDGLFGAKGSSPMTHITTTSEYEQHIMDEYFGYSPSNAPVVGFTRWDVLEDKSSPDEKIILVMPTWRAWLEEKTDEDFLASDYFRNYMEMLQDQSLAQCLKENDVKLIFFIHPKFKDFLSKFSAASDNIELVQFGTRPLNEIMMHCSMLITDYSSVCWDVYYMAKPVVFYQFDYDMYMENHGSYLDMEHDLFGERYTKLPDVIESIKRNIAEGFRESERAKEMRGKYFKYIDSDNSKRTYEYLKKRYK